MVVLAEVSISSTNHLPSAQTIEHKPPPFQLYFHRCRFYKLLWANLQNVNQKTFTKTRSDMPDCNNSLITSFAERLSLKLTTTYTEHVNGQRL